MLGIEEEEQTLIKEDLEIIILGITEDLINLEGDMDLEEEEEDLEEQDKEEDIKLNI